MKSQSSMYQLLRNVISVVMITMVFVISQATSAHAIINGQPDIANNYPYVGFVTDGMFVCSGAAIAPRVLITAAHCFAENGTRVAVTFDQQGWNAPYPDAFGTWYPYPNFCSSCGPGLPGFNPHDVAVVVFDSPVSLTRYALLPTVGLVDAQPMRTDVRIAGYGAQDQLRQLDYTEIFTRHFARTQLIQSNHSFNNQFLRLMANPANEGGGICFGDSGGPNILGDTGIILAINSYVINSNCAGVTYSYRIDTEEALDFIDSIVSTMN